MPNYDESDMGFIFRELHFEAATYALLQENSAIPVSRLVYFRVPVQHSGHKVDIPSNIDGRRVMVFEMV